MHHYNKYLVVQQVQDGEVVLKYQNKKKWKMRAEENARQWQGQQATDITKDNVTKAVDDYDSKNQSQQQQQSQNDNRMKNKLAQNIGTKNKEIWNAVSDFGADKSIDYKTFSDNLKD
eukprot:399857_1